MESFTRDGMFWQPAAPDRQVPGRLVFDNTGLHLTLFQPLRDTALLADQVVSSCLQLDEYPVLHADFYDGKAATLLGVSGYVSRGPFANGQEQYWLQTVLVGGHVESPSFGAVRIRFDVLDGWVHPAPLVEQDDLNTGQIVVRTERSVLAEVESGGLTVQLRSFPTGSWGGSVHLDQEVLIEVDGPPAASSTSWTTVSGSCRICSSW